MEPLPSDATLVPLPASSDMVLLPLPSGAVFADPLGMLADAATVRLCADISIMPDQEPVLAGYLRKEGATRGSESWKRRWFVLHKHALLYFKRQDSEAPQGEIPISAILGMTADTAAYPQPHSFQLVTAARVYALQAPLEAAQRHWLNAIAAAVCYSIQTQSAAAQAPAAAPHMTLDALARSVHFELPTAAARPVDASEGPSGVPALEHTRGSDGPLGAHAEQGDDGSDVDAPPHSYAGRAGTQQPDLSQALAMLENIQMALNAAKREKAAEVVLTDTRGSRTGGASTRDDAGRGRGRSTAPAQDVKYGSSRRRSVDSGSIEKPPVGGHRSSSVSRRSSFDDNGSQAQHRSSSVSRKPIASSAAAGEAGRRKASPPPARPPRNVTVHEHRRGGGASGISAPSSVVSAHSHASAPVVHAHNVAPSRLRLEYAKMWINSLGVGITLPMGGHNRIAAAFRDGTLLRSVLEAADRSVHIAGINSRPRARAMCIANLEKALQVIWKSRVKQSRIPTAEELYECKEERIAGLLPELLEGLALRRARSTCTTVMQWVVDVQQQYGYTPPLLAGWIPTATGHGAAAATGAASRVGSIKGLWKLVTDGLLLVHIAHYYGGDASDARKGLPDAPGSLARPAVDLSRVFARPVNAAQRAINWQLASAVLRDLSVPELTSLELLSTLHDDTASEEDDDVCLLQLYAVYERLGHLSSALRDIGEFPSAEEAHAEVTAGLLRGVNVGIATVPTASGSALQRVVVGHKYVDSEPLLPGSRAARLLSPPAAARTTHSSPGDADARFDSVSAAGSRGQAMGASPAALLSFQPHAGRNLGSPFESLSRNGPAEAGQAASAMELSTSAPEAPAVAAAVNAARDDANAALEAVAQNGHIVTATRSPVRKRTAPTLADILEQRDYLHEIALARAAGNRARSAAVLDVALRWANEKVASWALGAGATTSQVATVMASVPAAHTKALTATATLVSHTTVTAVNAPTVSVMPASKPVAAPVAAAPAPSVMATGETFATPPAPVPAPVVVQKASLPTAAQEQQRMVTEEKRSWELHRRLHGADEAALPARRDLFSISHRTQPLSWLPPLQAQAPPVPEVSTAHAASAAPHPSAPEPKPIEPPPVQFVSLPPEREGVDFTVVMKLPSGHMSPVRASVEASSGTGALTLSWQPLSVTVASPSQDAGRVFLRDLVGVQWRKDAATGAGSILARILAGRMHAFRTAGGLQSLELYADASPAGPHILQRLYATLAREHAHEMMALMSLSAPSQEQQVSFASPAPVSRDATAAASHPQQAGAPFRAPTHIISPPPGDGLSASQLTGSHASMPQRTYDGTDSLGSTAFFSVVHAAPRSAMFHSAAPQPVAAALPAPAPSAAPQAPTVPTGGFGASIAAARSAKSGGLLANFLAGRGPRAAGAVGAPL